jgi:hypothetical protein
MDSDRLSFPNNRPTPSLRSERRSLDSARPQLSPKDVKLPPSPPNEEEEATLEQTPSRPTASARGVSYPPVAPSQTPSPGLSVSLPHRPRTISPSRAVTRPHTSVGLPMMQRAHSSPGVDSSGRFVTPAYPRRPPSPLHSGRRRSPLRSSIEDTYPSWSGLSIEPNIPEDEELEIQLDSDYQTASPLPLYSNTFPRRRRPASPLHQSASAPSLYARGGSPSHSRSTSPSYLAAKYAAEPYPAYYSSASSMPSTPTSIRSRSPSISSLETIEDSPYAEELAMLEEEDNRKADDSDSSDSRRRSSMETRGSNLRSNKERKRWSVCGAERRADFSLDPIAE